MFCDRCGTSNRDDAQFCRACGAPLGDGARGSTATIVTPDASTSAVPETVRQALSDGYEVIKLLGQGGMGFVYLARELALDRLVAVKVLRADLLSDARHVQRFLQEARLAARLRHPNIASVHSAGDREGIRYFTMDYLEGQTLDQYVRQHGTGAGLGIEKARAIVTSIAQAVGYAHKQGIVHRDLKPNNVMVDPTEHIYVMDFGLAKPQATAHQTSSGAIVGTPQYMSPEQIDGRRATPRSDIYALGLIYFFLFSGENLVQGDSVSSVIAQHVSGSFRPRLTADPRIPGTEKPLMLAMLEVNPESRPASMEEVASAVERLAGQAMPPTLPIATLVTPPTPVTDVKTSDMPKGHQTPFRKQARERMKALLDKLQEPDK